MFYCIVSILFPATFCHKPTTHNANLVNINPNIITMANDINHSLKFKFNDFKKKAPNITPITTFVIMTLQAYKNSGTKLCSNRYTKLW